jgi:uncharacterized membrane protein (DUF373 family)
VSAESAALELVKKLERAVTLAVIVMLCIVVVLSTIELGFFLAKDIFAPPIFFPGIDQLLDIFGRVLLVLIGIELTESMRAFAAEGAVRAEVVLRVAMIAVARKIIILEPGQVSGFLLLAVAALLVGLSVAYRVFVRKSPLGGRGALQARLARRPSR